MQAVSMYMVMLESAVCIRGLSNSLKIPAYYLPRSFAKNYR